MKLQYSTSLPKSLDLLRDITEDAAKVVRRFIGETNNFVRTSKCHGVKALTDQVFQAASKLDDCAQAAPEGLFEHYGEGERRAVSIQFNENLLDHWNEPIMIVGAPGLGKTSYCRWHALRDAEKFKSGKSTILPIYVQLHRLSNQNLTALEDLLTLSSGKSGLLSADDIKSAVATGQRIRFYLDGLDEIASSAGRRSLVKLAQASIEMSDQYQVIITSRDYIKGAWLSWLPRISLSGFDGTQINSLVSKWLGEGTQNEMNFKDQLRGAPALANLMHIPLLASLIILVFRQTGKLPENRTKLYEIFITLLSGGWDMAKGVLRGTKYGERVKLMVLTTLARKLHEARTREFDNRLLMSSIKHHSKTILDDWETLRDELLADGLINSSGHTLHFSHFSFQEFLTAKDFIVGPRPRRALQALLLGDDWWREVFRFYIGLTGKPRETLLWLLSEFERCESKLENLDPSGDRRAGYSESDFEVPTLDRDRMDDVLAGMAESFPEFPIEDTIGYLPKSAEI